jgi:aldehyde:ferredoxin oxidoreductase
MGICDFWPITSETLGKLYEVTYGGNWPAEKVDRTGERIFNLQRMFNVVAGFTRKEDYLPDRFYEETLQDGPPKDRPMSRAAFDKALDDYYAFRGWDHEGRPKLETLTKLGIEDKFIAAYRKALKA